MITIINHFQPYQKYVRFAVRIRGVRQLTMGMVYPAGTKIFIQDPNPATIIFCNDKELQLVFFFGNLHKFI